MTKAENDSRNGNAALIATFPSLFLGALYKLSYVYIHCTSVSLKFDMKTKALVAND